MEEKKELIYVLDKKRLIGLLIYYVVLIIFGMVAVIWICSMPLKEMSESSLLVKYTFIVSLSASAMSCGMQYVRRLYKACITKRVVYYDDNSIELFGNMVYFITRPLFSLAFSTLVVVGLLAGMFLVTGSLDYVINDKFLYLCLIISSLTGYSVGQVLDRFEKISRKTSSEN